MTLPPFHLAFPVDDLAAARRFHFGVVLPMEEWKALAARLEEAGVGFVIPPTIRFEGQPGEQATMFFRDPAGNALEFKAMADPAKLFAKEQRISPRSS